MPNKRVRICEPIEEIKDDILSDSEIDYSPQKVQTISKAIRKGLK